MKCGESWEVYHIIHDEGLINIINELDAQDSTEIFIESKDFKIQELCGWNEVPEGHFLIHRCPYCKVNNV